MAKIKKYTGIVREKRNGYLKHINSDYTSKKKFAKDLRNNGYRVVKVYSKKNIKDVHDKPYWETLEEHEQYVEQVEDVKEYHGLM